jgi:hypothetical protein
LAAVFVIFLYTHCTSVPCGGRIALERVYTIPLR